MNVIVFKISDKEYGVDIKQAKEVIRARKITPVPEVSGFVAGVIVLRGKIIPLVDLCKKFGLESKELNKSSRIIVIQLANHLIGVIVDSVNEVLNIKEENITAPDEILNQAKYLVGLINYNKRLILLTDMVKLLSEEETTHVQKIFDKVEVRRKV